MYEIDAFYCYEWKVGKACLPDIEPRVIGHFSINGNGGDPEIRVTELLIDGVDLLKMPSPSVKFLAEEIKEAVQNDTDWIADQAYALGYTYESRGVTDPEAYWRAA